MHAVTLSSPGDTHTAAEDLRTVQARRDRAALRSSVYPFAASVILLSIAILSVHVPGSYTQDSLYTLNEALTTKVGHFDEWLSPAYSLIWKVMISIGVAIHLSPFWQMSAMCVLQTVLIVGALLQLLYANSRMTWLAVTGVATVVVSSPAVFVYLGEIWRDVLMAALLLVAVCLLDLVRRTGSRKAFAGAMCGLFLAGLIRQTAVIAELPLFLWSGELWWRAHPSGRKYTYTIGAAAIFIIVFAAFVATTNRLLAASNYGRVASATMYYDLMGMSVRTKALLLPKSLTAPDYSLETVRSHYQDEYSDLRGIIFPSSPQQMKTIATAWRDAVLTHPNAYLQHRWFVTRRFLGISDIPHLPYFYGIPDVLYPRYLQDTAYYVRFPTSAPRRWVARYLSLVSYWMFRPWIYVVLGLGVLLLYRRRVEAPFWLCASGGIYWLSFALSAPSSDFRYSWWNVLAVTTALALLCVRGIRNEREITMADGERRNA